MTKQLVADLYTEEEIAGILAGLKAELPLLILLYGSGLHDIQRPLYRSGRSEAWVDRWTPPVFLWFLERYAATDWAKIGPGERNPEEMGYDQIWSAMLGENFFSFIKRRFRTKGETMLWDDTLDEVQYYQNLVRDLEEENAD